MASETKEELVFERRIQASPEELYDAWAHASALREWLCDGATLGRKPGERFILWWEDGYTSAGRLLGQIPPERLSFTWDGATDPAPTQVDVLLHEEENGETTVTVRHAGIGDDEAWAGFRKEIARGWERGLENLQATVETGEDLRLVRRPILGILVGEYSAGIAERLGIPNTEGVRVDGVARKGNGADKAGLRTDDVIIGLGGEEVIGWPSLMAALEKHKSGDTVEVSFMRMGEQRTTQLTLDKRHLPDVRDRAAVLRQIAEGYRKSYETVAGLLSGVSDEKALKRPKPDQWSALEVVAHLILVEREVHTLIGDLLNHDERWGDENPTNIPARVAAVAATYPTVKAMQLALHDAYTETQALMAALPDAFVRRRATWTRIARTVLGLTEYGESHADQIRRAL